VVHGIASMRDLGKVGRVGLKALVYFELVSTLALAIGLAVRRARPSGRRLQHRRGEPRREIGVGYVTRAKQEGIVAHLLAIIRTTFVDAFAKGDLLQVLLIAILTGFASPAMGALGEKITARSTRPEKLLFRIIGIIVRAAPIRRVRGDGVHHRRLRHRRAAETWAS